MGFLFGNFLSGGDEDPITLTLFVNEGLWKCRHCSWTWTNLFGNPGTFHNHNSRECFPDMVISIKSLGPKGSCFVFESKGTELTDGDSCIENGNQESFIDENLILEVKKVDIQNSTTYEPNHQFTQNSVKGSFSGFNPSTLEDSSEGQNAGLQFESKSSEDSDEIEEVDQEGTDLDVERVLKEQDTHELYCPNCHSCITRRVILLRRKRKVRKLKNKPKHEKVETVDPSNLIPKNVVDSSNLVNNSSTGSQTPGDDVHELETERDVFRCLACFSFFIPTGNGFKLFQSSRHDSENEDMLNSENTGAAAKKNWFLSCFGSGDHSDQTVVNNQEPAEAANIRSQQDAQESLNSLIVEINQNGTSSAATPVKTATTESKGTGMTDNLPPEHKRVDIVFPISGNTSVIENPAGDVGHSPNDVKEASNLRTETVEKGTDMSIKDRVLLIDSFLSDVPDNVTSGSHEIKTEATVSLTRGSEQSEEIKVAIKETADGVSKRKTDGGLQVIVESVTDGHQDEVARESYQLDILKSIVYGGLVESITSLGVVSSAAGSGTATLNILVLALANLIGGLTLIVHNLRELRNDDPRPTTDQLNEQEDRYERLLGKRRNYTIHAVVAIISFIVFGLVPPVLYGFTFQKTGDRDYKLAATAGASLICITLLAIGKGHIQNRSYIKTVLYYLSIGFAASGASYVAGDLLNELIEKLGWLNPSPSPSPSSGVSVAMSFSDKILTGQGWASN